jgi:hypothetical protein
MTGNMAFGTKGRFYTESHPPRPKIREKDLSAEEHMVWRLLRDHDDKLPERVARSYKQWNLIVRDYLRNETALRLSVGNDHQAVPVRVCDGLPRPLRELVSRFPGRELWELQLSKGKIEGAVAGLEVLCRSHGFLASDAFLGMASDRARGKGEPVPPTPSASELAGCADFAGFVSSSLEEVQILKRLMEINEDVLGAYFFRVPEVRLYWMAIGIVAGMLGVTAESLTVVVLAHELAHAYTHLGSDIDGQRWANERFAAANLHVVEGLAQFYAETVCTKMLQRYPAPMDTFRRLVKLQPPPYTLYREWCEEIGPSRAGEAFRFAMIQERSVGEGSTHGFVIELEKAKAPPHA